uniref:Uncharacterized protein n=1 Tax=Glossina austeni TaxID=7395 RepID=A0A1A9UW80_GLOAU
MLINEDIIKCLSVDKELLMETRNGAGGVSSQPIRPSEDGSHHLQEYTYKKITACDVCSQILRDRDFLCLHVSDNHEVISFPVMIKGEHSLLLLLNDAKDMKR